MLTRCYLHAAQLEYTQLTAKVEPEYPSPPLNPDNEWLEFRHATFISKGQCQFCML